MLLIPAMPFHDHFNILILDISSYLLVYNFMKLVPTDEALLIETPMIEQFHHIFAVLKYFP